LVYFGEPREACKKGGKASSGACPLVYFGEPREACKKGQDFHSQDIALTLWAMAKTSMQAPDAFETLHSGGWRNTRTKGSEEMEEGKGEEAGTTDTFPMDSTSVAFHEFLG
jgi:hypothetical protein